MLIRNRFYSFLVLAHTKSSISFSNNSFADFGHIITRWSLSAYARGAVQPIVIETVRKSVNGIHRYITVEYEGTRDRRGDRIAISLVFRLSRWEWTSGSPGLTDGVALPRRRIDRATRKTRAVVRSRRVTPDGTETSLFLSGRYEALGKTTWPRTCIDRISGWNRQLVIGSLTSCDVLINTLVSLTRGNIWLHNDPPTSTSQRSGGLRCLFKKFSFSSIFNWKKNTI